MIRICILSSLSVWLKNHLKDLGFQVTSITECDAILSDRPVEGATVPVVLYTKQKDLRHVITEAVVAERFKPLTSTIDECLNILKE